MRGKGDQNVPPAEPESAPPADPRALEDENVRLRQTNAELHRRLMEGRAQIMAVLDEADRHINWVKEQDQARQQAWASAEMDEEVSRVRALERENSQMRYQLNDLHSK